MLRSFRHTTSRWPNVSAKGCWCISPSGVTRTGLAVRYERQSAKAESRMPYKVNEKRGHKIPKARYRVQNWREMMRRCVGAVT